MALVYLYEPQYLVSGWLDDDSGLSMASWFDQDISDTPDAIIPIYVFEPIFLDDDDVFFMGDDVPVQLPGGRPMLPAQWQPHITVELLPAFFDDPDTFYHPIGMRAMHAPDQELKNEIRRIR